MAEEQKEKVVVVGTKKWNETYKKIVDLSARVKDIELAVPAGKTTGKVAAKLIKPFTNFIHGVKKGWKE